MRTRRFVRLFGSGGPSRTALPTEGRPIQFSIVREQRPLGHAQRGSMNGAGALVSLPSGATRFTKSENCLRKPVLGYLWSAPYQGPSTQKRRGVPEREGVSSCLERKMVVATSSWRARGPSASNALFVPSDKVPALGRRPVGHLLALVTLPRKNRERICHSYRALE